MRSGSTTPSKKRSHKFSSACNSQANPSRRSYLSRRKRLRGISSMGYHRAQAEGENGRAPSANQPAPRTPQTSALWIPAGCPVCKGDLFLEPTDENMFTCLMCGRSWPISLFRPETSQSRTTRYSIPDSGDPADIDWDT